MLFEEKSPALLVPVADGGDKDTKKQNYRPINIATYRLNRSRGQFSENTKIVLETRIFLLINII